MSASLQGELVRAAEQAAGYLVKLNVRSVTCCLLPGCLGKRLKRPQTRQLLSPVNAQKRGKCRRGPGVVLAVAGDVAGEPHTCQLRLPQISWELTKQLFVSTDGKIMR